MTTISVPAWLPTEPEPEVQPDAGAVLIDVRAAAASTSDVASWAGSNGAPADFTGSAADCADHAVTQFADATDAVTAALEKGALAIDRFLTAMAQRRTEHAELMERRTRLNSALQTLLDRIGTSTGEDVPALQAAAETLRSRFDAYHADVDAWRRRIESDEDAAIASLQAVDTLAEGDSAADAPGRTDTSALVAQLQRLGTDTDAVNIWWNDVLTEAERNALLISDPGLVGNTNGIPTGDRDEANRASVQRDIEHLLGLEASGQDLSAADRRWLENAQAIEVAIAQAGEHPYDRLDIEAYVLAYQPHAFGGDGIAAVSYGNPDTAEHTAVYVPGIMQDGTRIDDNAADALLLHDEALATGASVATITWIGYDSPNLHPDSVPWGVPESAADVAHTATETNAEQGGVLLSQLVDGLNTTHTSGDQPHLTVIGHSYGSTTAAHAAADGMEADSLVLIGSPGAGGGVDHVSGLGMPEGQVFVGSRDNDPVTWLGGRDGLFPTTRDDALGLGEDPAQSDFGAHVFPVGPGVELEGLGGLTSDGFMGNHVTYFQDPEALASMTNVVIGNGQAVDDTGGRTSDAHDYLYEWGRGELQESYDEHVQPVVDDVVNTYEDVRDGAVETYEGVRDGAAETYERVRDGALGTYEGVRDEAVETYGEVRDDVDRAVDDGRKAWDDFWKDPWP